MLTSQDFGGINWLHRGETDGKYDAEYEYEGNTGRAARNTARPFVLGSGCRHQSHGNGHAHARVQKHFPPTDDIMKTGCSS